MTEVMIKNAVERARIDRSRLALFDHLGTHGQHIPLGCMATQLLVAIARHSDGRMVSASDHLLAAWLGAVTIGTAGKARRRLMEAGYLRRIATARYTVLLPLCRCEEDQP